MIGYHRYSVAVCATCRGQLSTDGEGDLDPCMNLDCPGPCGPSGWGEHVWIDLFVPDFMARRKVNRAKKKRSARTPPPVRH